MWVCTSSTLRWELVRAFCIIQMALKACQLNYRGFTRNIMSCRTISGVTSPLTNWEKPRTLDSTGEGEGLAVHHWLSGTEIWLSVLDHCSGKFLLLNFIAGFMQQALLSSLYWYLKPLGHIKVLLISDVRSDYLHFQLAFGHSWENQT